MSTLELHSYDKEDKLQFPSDGQAYSLSSSPLLFFSDFQKERPLVVDINLPALEAKRIMRSSRVNTCVVVDRKSEFCGVLVLDDLAAQEIMKKQTSGFDRADITVRDFYRSREQLFSIDYTELSRSRILDVIRVLQRFGLQYCLVSDRINHTLRGVLSAEQIAKKLNLDIDESRAVNFYEIFKTIHASQLKPSSAAVG
ncbi:hypothetical protein TDB9533_04142 [Thalassocella blandensis]|nr:hypothetical protein TDB9533_04142 [Thalassocella blandensis]